MVDFGIPIVPGWVMLVLLATASAAAYKLISGKKTRGLGQCIIIALIGFTAGQIIAEHISMPISLPEFGDLHWPQALVVGWLFLFIVGRSRLW